MFISQLEGLLKRCELISSPAQIFNCDETGIGSKIATRTKAYGQKGTSVYQKKVRLDKNDHMSQTVYIRVIGNCRTHTVHIIQS